MPKTTAWTFQNFAFLRVPFSFGFSDFVHTVHDDGKNDRQHEHRYAQNCKTNGGRYEMIEEINIIIERILQRGNRFGGRVFRHFFDGAAHEEPAKEHGAVSTGHKRDEIADSRGKLRDGHIRAAKKAVHGRNQRRRRARRPLRLQKGFDDDRPSPPVNSPYPYDT